MRFQATLEDAECLRRNDVGWQSVPDARCSDEERAVTNRRTTRRRWNKQPLFIRNSPSLKIFKSRIQTEIICLSIIHTCTRPICNI